MSMLDGVSQCWPLAKDCVVWWDAWAVVFACAGVIVTAIASYAVFVVSRAANRVAASVHTEAEHARRREAIFLAAYLYSEIVEANAGVSSWLEMIDKLTFPEVARRGREFRRNLLQLIIEVDLPLSRQNLGRLHVLDEDVGIALARAISTINFVKDAVPRLDRIEEDKKGVEGLAATIEHVITLKQDLGVVLAAGRKARGVA